MAKLLFFGPARIAAGAAHADVAASSVGELCDRARERFGAEFAAVLDTSSVWVNGEPADSTRTLEVDDEVAVLPPVSGGV